MMLQHTFEGVELKTDYARDTLANLYRLWKRPVHISTVMKDEPVTLSFDGSEHTSSTQKPSTTEKFK